MTSFPPPDSGPENGTPQYGGPPSLQKPPTPYDQPTGHPTQPAPYGQQYDQPGGQQYGQPGGQQYGQPGGQQYGQPDPAYGQPYGPPDPAYGQPHGQPYSGPGGQPYGSGYPPPGYGYPSGYPVTAGPGQNGLGVAGMVTGIAGLVLCWIPFFGGFVALVGAILSGVAIPQARSRRQGIGMAVAGLACGILGVVIGVLWIGLFVFASSYDSSYTY